MYRNTLISLRTKVALLFFSLSALLGFLIWWDDDYQMFFAGSNTNYDRQRGELMTYYSLEQDRPKHHLKATFIEIARDFFVFDLTAPQLVTQVLQKSNNSFLPMRANSDRARFVKDRGELTMEGRVSFYYQDWEGHCEQATLWTFRDYYECHRESQLKALDPRTKDRLQLNSQRLQADLVREHALAQGQVVGTVTPLRLLRKGTRFEAQEAEMWGPRSEVELRQQVVVDHEDFHVESKTAKLFLDHYQRELTYFSFTDDVSILQRMPGGAPDRRAYAAFAEGIRSKGQLILTGAPTVLQGKDIIKGNRITLYQGSRLIEVDDAASSIIYEEKNNEPVNESINKPLKQSSPISPDPSGSGDQKIL